MLLTRTSAPADLISLADLKAHLRIDHAYDDTALDIYRAVAIQALDGRDGYLRRALVQQTWVWELPLFPYGTELHFPLPPLQSVTSIEYYDVDNALQTFASSNYIVHANAHVGYVKLTPSGAWPSTYERDNAVKVTFVAGYGAASTVPNPIKWAALLLAGRLYANRGDGDDSKQADGDTAMQETERRLLAPYRLQEFVSSNEQYWKQARAYPHR